MISEKQKELLQHMLGADSRYMKKVWGSGTFFVLTKGIKIFQSCAKWKGLA